MAFRKRTRQSAKMVAARAAKARLRVTDHIETLRQYNLWRRGAEMDRPHPDVIGKAIDAAISEIELLRRGECICIRCGLRQDGEKTLGDF